jgi:hypothetical protein
MNEAHICLENDSPSSTPVHSQTRAIGPQDLHLAKGRGLAAKRQEEVFERELMTMLTSVHVENSRPLLGSDRPLHAHFTAENC